MFLLGRHAALINSTSTSNTADRQTAKAFQCFSLATRHKGHPESCPSAKVQECEDTRPSLYVHTVVQTVAVGRQVFLPALNWKNKSFYGTYYFFITWTRFAHPPLTQGRVNSIVSYIGFVLSKWDIMKMFCMQLEVRFRFTQTGSMRHSS